MTLRVLPRLACLLCVIGCGADDSAADATAADTKAATMFARYWADGSRWCTRIDECGLAVKAACETSWVTTGATLESIREQALSEAYLSRCEASSRALDGCALALACDDFELFTTALTTGPCVPQKRKFSETCDALTSVNDTAPDADAGASDDAGR